MGARPLDLDSLAKSDAHTAHIIMVVSKSASRARWSMITPMIRHSLGRHWGIFFTLLTAVFFYPSGLGVDRELVPARLRSADLPLA